MSSMPSQTIKTLRLPRPHEAQRLVLAGQRRYNVLACGRRWGKSHLLLDRLADTVLRGRAYAHFAPNYKLLGDFWRAALRLLKPIISGSNRTDRRIEFVTGGVAEMWTLEDEDAGRSRKYHEVGIDEAGLVPDLGAIWTAAIRPTLIDERGGAWFAGTPKGRNYFWEAFQRGLDPREDDWAAWQMPTSANPYMPLDEIAVMRAELPERIARQEIDAQFLEDSGGVFRDVRAAATAQAQFRPVPGHHYIIGADWGRQVDFTVFAVLDATTGELVAMDRSNKVEYATQRGRLQALCQRFDPLAVIAEENAMGAPIIEQLRRDGMPVKPFVTTNASKAEIIDGLTLAFERDAIRILPDETLIGELEAYEVSRTSSGLTRYSAPAGMHDDTVIALALAWYGAQRPKLQSARVDFYAKRQAERAVAIARSDSEIEDLLEQQHL